MGLWRDDGRKNIYNSINSNYPSYSYENSSEDESDLPEFSDEISAADTISKQSSLFHKKRRKITILVLLSLSSISLAESISLFPPFYPKIAEDKGASASVYGFVLGSNSLVMFLVTPFIGKHIKSIGMKFALTSGMFVNGACCILSGFLDGMPPGSVFICMSIAIRTVHALGNAAVITSSFAIMATEFPDSVARVYGLTRIFLNVGFLIGPVVGGALYQVGGYRLPFIILGGIQCAVAILTLLLHPRYAAEAFEGDDVCERRITIIGILRIPSVWLAFGCFVVSTFTNGFLSVTLEPQVLRQFTLAPILMGLLFGLKDGVSGISSPLWGWLCDKTKSIKPFIIICSVTSGCSLLLLDHPSKTLFVPALWLVILGLILSGIGTSGEQVIAVLDSLRNIMDAGTPEDPSIHGCIAGLWSSLCGLGRFLSRSLSGILVDHFGHSGVTMFVAGLNLLLAIATIIFLSTQTYKLRPSRSTAEESGIMKPVRY